MISNQSGKVIPFGPRSSMADDVVQLAFAYWHERFGLRDGSPEEDLIRAQRELCRRNTGNAGLYLVHTSPSIKDGHQGC